MKGRGIATNSINRFNDRIIESDQPEYGLIAQYIREEAKSLLTRNVSPDVPFSVSINPYRGCEHGCTYCYARASHSFLGYSPGLDFETQIHFKHNAVTVLRKELCATKYECVPIALGNNTDAYQPVESRLSLTRKIVELLAETSHPLTIVTKSSRILRDLDLLRLMAQKQLLHVHISITSLDHRLAANMEPRAAAPARRLDTVARLHEAGVPVGILVAPVIPGINDHEMEDILTAAAERGAVSAGYVVLRLPHEVKEVFFAWLQEHFPGKVSKIKRHLLSLHAGNEYRSEFGTRMVGSGPIAMLLEQRFRRVCRQLGLNRKAVTLRTDLFTPPKETGGQLCLF